MCFTPHLETDYLKPFIEKSNVWLISFFTLSIIYWASSIKQVLWSGRKNFFSHPLFFFQQVQYKFCYEITRLFVDSYSDYANFRWYKKSSSNFHFTINVWNVQVQFKFISTNWTQTSRATGCWVIWRHGDVFIIPLSNRRFRRERAVFLLDKKNRKFLGCSVWRANSTMV